MKIWKLISAIILTLALMVISPYLLERLGLMAPVSTKALYILIITAVGLVLKIVVGDLVSGEFNYHKHGYDLCIITLGASLSSMSLQLTSNYDLFPGLPKTGWIKILESISSDIVIQRVVLLSGIFLLSCIMALLTARIVIAIKDEETMGKSYLSLINFLLGAGVFATYIFIVITKG